MNLIVVNIGNTRTACGLFSQGKLIETWHHETTESIDIAQSILEKTSHTHVAICSVVPAATKILSEYLKLKGPENYPVHIITAKNQRLLKATYKTMGMDRIANAVAAWKLYAKTDPISIPVAVIDLGTATTLTAIKTDGSFGGGLITLGLNRAFKALHLNTALLPDITLGDSHSELSPLLPLNFDTESAIINGTILAHVGLIEYWIKLVKENLGQNTTIVATGGWSKTLSQYSQALGQVDPDLTLKGIYFMAMAEINPREITLMDPA